MYPIFQKFMDLGAQMPNDFVLKGCDGVMPGEKVLGPLPDSVLRLFYVRRQLKTEIDKAGKAHEQVCKGDDSCTKLHEEILRKAECMKLLNDLAWVSVREEVPNSMPSDEEGVAIRRGEDGGYVLVRYNVLAEILAEGVPSGLLTTLGDAVFAARLRGGPRQES